MFQLYYKFLLLFLFFLLQGRYQVSEGFQTGHFQRVSNGFIGVSEGFRRGFKVFQKGFERVSKLIYCGLKAFEASFERVLKCLKGSQRALKGKMVLKGFQTL